MDYSPLRFYALIFRFYIWMKRARMIALRIIILGIMSLLVIDIIRSDGEVYSASGSFSSSGSFDPMLLIIVWFLITFILITVQSYFWQQFAQKNNFTPVSRQMGMSNDFSETKVPSFKAKIMHQSLTPLQKQFGLAELTVFTRIYKEGGIIRWRERKMDSIIKLKYSNVRLPHIIINATANEKARRSNLTKRYPAETKFSFEGVQGEHYDAYTPKENRVLALQLFTPDVLSVLYDHMPSMDIEVKGQTIWFVQRYGIFDARLAESMFTAIAEFQQEFEKQLRSARYI